MKNNAQILFVDDDADLRYTIAKILASEGYDVIEAKSGEECLSILEKNVPDLIILDVRLGDLNGIELCRQIKGIPKYSGIYIILLSGKKISSTDKTLGLNLGADEYITKPIASDELLAKIKSFLRRKESEKERERLENTLHRKLRLESLETLANGLGHEINNPLMGMINYAQLILDNLGDQDINGKYAAEIIVEGERIKKIVASLASFIIDEKENFSIVEPGVIVEELTDYVMPDIEKSGIILEAKVDDGLHSLRCKKIHILNTLKSIILNSINSLDRKFNRQDPLKKIILLTSEIIRDSKPYIKFSIEDYGEGISPAHKEKLFEPFFTTKSRLEGRGMSLFVCHNIIKEHNGELNLESEYGCYTRFEILLPAECPVR